MRVMFRTLFLLMGLLAFTKFANAQDVISPVTFVGGPDLNTFPITTKITQVDVTLTGVEAHFDKREGPNRWPDNTTPGWSGALQYSLGICEHLEGGWFCSAPIETWFGANVIGGPIQQQDPPQITKNWFYRSQWSPLDQHQPTPGEQLGVFVVAGDARNSFNPVKERSNIVLITLPAPNTTAVFRLETPVPTPAPVTNPPPPAPLPAPITPVPAPTPIPAADPSLQGILASLDQCIAEVQAGRAENQAFYASVKSTWQAYGLPLVKYVVPAVAAFFAGKHL